MNAAKRNPAADIIRILALFLVVSVHFFINNGFYTHPIVGKRMFVMTLMRAFFIICVPLFITLSGYLLRKKTLSKKYYARIIKIIITYLLASLLCVAYSIIFLQQEMSVKDIILNILSFKAAPYSWYIEMYLGLFLLIPFLNITYNSLPSQKWKIILVVTFVILTALPSALNIYDLSSLAGLIKPSSTTTAHKIVPSWWQSFYPVTYYFIGCYLSEYGLKINKTLHGFLIVFWTILSGAFCYWRSYKVNFISGAWCSYQSLFNVVLTILVFTFFININYEKMPSKLSMILQKISGLCLGGYLVSWIFDKALYPILREKVPLATDTLEYYFVFVPTVFVLSLVAAYLLSKIRCIIEKGYALIYRQVQKKLQKEKETIEV